jgi:hypothetical protein
MDYTPKIPKTELRHGAYYTGHCRNATLARWHGPEQQFYHWRSKFGMRFIETIRAPEDEQQYDVFVAEHETMNTETIPFPEEE